MDIRERLLGGLLPRAGLNRRASIGLGVGIHFAPQGPLDELRQ